MPVSSVIWFYARQIYTLRLFESYAPHALLPALLKISRSAARPPGGGFIPAHGHQFWRLLTEVTILVPFPYHLPIAGQRQDALSTYCSQANALGLCLYQVVSWRKRRLRSALGRRFRAGALFEAACRHRLMHACARRSFATILMADYQSVPP